MTDLYVKAQWSQMWIRAIELSEAHVVIETVDNDLNKGLKKRIKIIEFSDVFVTENQTLILSVNEEVMRKESVVVGDYFFLEKWKKYYIDRGLVEDIDFTVFTPPEMFQYFIPIHESMDVQYVDVFNQV